MEPAFVIRSKRLARSLDNIQGVRTNEQQKEYLNEGRFQHSGSRSPFSRLWVAWLVTLLFPIPFGPWWLTLLCLLVFGLLAYLIWGGPKPD
jgi:hypothetical protein